MKSFSVVTTKVYEPIWVRIHFSRYTSGFKALRDKMTYKANTCIKCHHKFEENEEVSLAAFKGIGNKVLCVPCAEEISA